MINNNINSLANAVAKLSNAEYADFWDTLLKRRQPAKPEVPAETLNKFVETLKTLAKEEKIETEGTISFKVKISESTYFDRRDQTIYSDSSTVEIKDLKADFNQSPGGLALDLERLEGELSYAIESNQTKTESQKMQDYLVENNHKLQTLINEIYDLEDAAGVEILEDVLDRFENRRSRKHPRIQDFLVKPIKSRRRR